MRALEVSAIGYGCMGLSHGYGPVPDRSEAIKLIRQAYDLGCTFFDTAEGYGMGANEELMGCSSNTGGDKYRGNAINTGPPSIAFSMTRRIRRSASVALDPSNY